MRLFVTFGSWGEIAPLLEIAIQCQERGEDIAFATTPDWSPRVRAYGVSCFDLPKAEKHADTIDAFLGAHLLGRIRDIYDVIAEAKPSSLVAAFYCLPAQAYAATYSLPLVSTTTSPLYFLQTGDMPAFQQCFDEYLALCEAIKAPERAYPLAGAYPWYLDETVGAVNVGFPELRPLAPLSAEVAEFIKQPYGVITRGTMVSSDQLDRMVNAIHAHGLKCLYLGKQPCKADLSVFVDDHRAAVKSATVAITHAGVGTTVACMGSAMVVDPVAYDQFYNANRLIALKCAIGVKDSYIKAISEALKPRSYLPNSFNLDQFLGLA